MMSQTEPERIRQVYAARAGGWRYSMKNASFVARTNDLAGYVRSLLDRHLIPLSRCRVLEVGCGSGHWLRQFVRWGAQPDRIAGVDLIPRSLHAADRSVNGSLCLSIANGTALPFRTGSMDLVSQFIMMSSVLDPGIRREIASEMLRVLAPGGSILWYDMAVNNPFNPNVRGIDRRELQQLFPHCTIDRHRITLIPQLARVLPITITRWLERLTVLNTFYLAVIRPR